VRVAITAITDNGLASAQELSALLPDSTVFNLKGKGKLRSWVEENFHKYEGHVFIMSMGIVYRLIAPLITNKYRDPAVVVVDDARRHAIAALSGHEGGANNLTFKVARILDAQPVVTTASDTNRRVIVGIGCRKGCGADEIKRALAQALNENEIKAEEIRLAASVDIKKEEKGMIEAFDQLGIPLLFISSDTIRNFTGYKNVSEAAQRQLGLPGVSEPCALLGGRNTALIQERMKIGPVTIALAREDEK
jgi:cobalamin biosynthesis protein CbiG